MFRSILKKFLAQNGYEIRRIHQEPAYKKVDSVINYNSGNSMDLIYADPEYYKEYVNPTTTKFFEDLINKSIERKIDFNNKKIADIGCGIGLLFKEVQKRRFSNISLHGFDFSKEAIKMAQQQIPAACFATFDIYQPLRDEFDIIYCTEVLEHLIQPEEAIRNILANLKFGGYSILTVPDGRRDTYAGHINFWSAESWQEFIKKNCCDNSYETGYIGDNSDVFAIIHRNCQ